MSEEKSTLSEADLKKAVAANKRIAERLGKGALGASAAHEKRFKPPPYNANDTAGWETRMAEHLTLLGLMWAVERTTDPPLLRESVLGVGDTLVQAAAKDLSSEQDAWLTASQTAYMCVKESSRYRVVV